MNSKQNYVKSIGWLTIFSGLLAFTCNVLLAFAVRFDFEAFADPTRLFNGFEASQAEFFRWGMITDIWGYYLLLAPAVLFFYEQMDTPWRRVFVASGLAYVLLGAAGAAILAAAGTGFLREYGAAGVAEQVVSKNGFLMVYRVVNDGIWNLLEMGLFGIFCFGVAFLLKAQHKPLFYLTIVLAISGILDSVAHTFEWPFVANIGVNIYLALAPIWAIWIGLRWLRSDKI